ncbi:MAG: WbqC family protein [Candidatus Omnitrophica bacterium]|nr:WbqC family protein [Candidatus Omnitrophota bacterium]
MRCVIMQPTYLPWAGYFNLIASSDTFVFLDDVQYKKTSWQNRNRVLVKGKPQWLTVPAVRSGLNDLIMTIGLDDHQRWREKHCRLITQEFSKHPYGQEFSFVTEIIADASTNRLADLNIRIIVALAERLGLAKTFTRSSALDIGGSRSERLLAICRHFSCDEYLSPLGSRDYLMDDGAFQHSCIRLQFQNYIPGEYPQKNVQKFVGFLSVLDVIANIGWEAASHYVKTGNYIADKTTFDTTNLKG